MIIPQTIKKLNKKLIKYSDELEVCVKKNKSRKLFLKLKKQQIDTDREISRLIVGILDDSNENFRRVADKNYKLLYNNNFKFKTTQKGMSLFGTHASLLDGYIHDNGFAYCQTKKTNFPLFSLFADFEYPSRFEGFIDCLGNILLEVKQTKYGCEKRVPMAFDSRIFNNGKIILDTTDLDPDFFSEGKHIISNIIGSPFAHKEDELLLFLENKRILINMINDFRNENNLYVITNHHELY